MKRGAISSQSRASSLDGADQLGQDVARLADLSCRFERLLKRVRILAGHCEQAPENLRDSLKQFLDLAVIEMEEGFQALVSYQGRLSQSVTVPESESGKLSSEQPVADSPIEPQATALASVPPVVSENEDCEQGIEPTFDNIEMSFNTMARLAEIPEAADLNAILARLESGDDASDADEFRRPIQDSPTNTREQLLGFDVCRMEVRPNPATPAAAEPQNLPQNLSQNLSQSRTNRALAAADRADSHHISAAEVVFTSAGDSHSAGDSLRYAAALSAGLPAEAGGFPIASGAYGSREQVEDGADVQPVLPVPAAEVNDAEVKGAAESLSGHSPIPSNLESPARQNPNSAPSPSRGHASEQVEDVNPLESIAPENLEAILSLKEELILVSSKFKNSGVF